MSETTTGSRRMTQNCKHCGRSDSVESAKLSAVEMLHELGELHDLMSPDCPNRFHPSSSSSSPDLSGSV